MYRSSYTNFVLENIRYSRALQGSDIPKGLTIPTVNNSSEKTVPGKTKIEDVVGDWRPTGAIKRGNDHSCALPKKQLCSIMSSNGAYARYTANQGGANPNPYGQPGYGGAAAAGYGQSGYGGGYGAGPTPGYGGAPPAYRGPAAPSSGDYAQVCKLIITSIICHLLQRVIQILISRPDHFMVSRFSQLAFLDLFSDW